MVELFMVEFVFGWWVVVEVGGMSEDNFIFQFGFEVWCVLFYEWVFVFDGVFDDDNGMLLMMQLFMFLFEDFVVDIVFWIYFFGGFVLLMLVICDFMGFVLNDVLMLVFGFVCSVGQFFFLVGVLGKWCVFLYVCIFMYQGLVGIGGLVVEIEGQVDDL